jgi:NDP-mannose synthase
MAGPADGTAGGGRHAVILAGGRGTRLRPYTTTLPKPLVPIGDEYAILEIVLRQLARKGFRRATIAIGYLGALIRAYVGDGSQWGLEVDYATEDRPLGTMGPVVANLDRLPEHFLVMNGDILTDLDFADLLDRHVARGAPLTVGTYHREVKIDFGVLEVDDASRIVAFREKPVLPYSVSMGVYGLSRATLARFEPGQPLGFDELVLDLIARGDPPAAYPFAGHWLDIGRPEDYDQANLDFDAIRHTFLLPE